MNYEKISAPIILDFPEEWYGYASADHFWLRWRMRVFQRFISDRFLTAQEPFRALEIGCGRGLLRSEIEANTRWIVDGADINETALQEAIPGRGRTLLYDIQDRLPELHEAYDALVLFDVLEHIQEPDSFLVAACWHLKPGGWILINVPALTALLSRYDAAVGHFRRYHPGSIRRLAKSQTPELEVVEIRYWGFLLIPIAGLRKFLLKLIRADKVVVTGFQPPSRWINSLLRGVMLLETFCLNRPPLGTSIMAIARKSGSLPT